ncbi:40179_t:CDS:10 [Gigaspora margarita]|uniref:40179_t:CDS:1 n=1 Tax=Gigaspora margarita TaxID=4874 RepID=A0ABN7V2U0_GIGMA|nr:40179_t:CDS:10 [Gigaspora margarita]
MDVFIPFDDITHIKPIYEGTFSDIELSEYKSKRINVAVARAPNGISCLIMDYVENGNLHDYFEENKLEWSAKLKMTIDIAIGLLECHENGIIHSNINSENILVDESVDKCLVLKIAGFGYITNRKFDNIETIRWAAPEHINDEQNIDEERSDIYSCGLVMYEIAMNGKKPYEDIEDFDKLKKAKVSGDIKDLIKDLEDKDAPGKLKSLIKGCCDLVPSKRIKLADVIFDLKNLWHEKYREKQERNINKIVSEIKEGNLGNLKVFNYEDFKVIHIQDIPGLSNISDELSEIKCACLKTNDTHVVLKTLKCEEDKYYAIVNREIKIFNEIGPNENVIKFLGVTKGLYEDFYSIVLEYCGDKNLSEDLEEVSKKDWVDKINMAKGLANGLKFVHAEKIILCNLNSKNIIIHNDKLVISDFSSAMFYKKNNDNLVIADFSSSISPNSKPKPTIKITRENVAYVDPKRFDPDSKLNESSDIYSLGVILWEISSGRPAFLNHGLDIDKLKDSLIRNERESPINLTPVDFIELYCDAWNENDYNRPPIKDVISCLNEIDLDFVYRDHDHDYTSEISYGKTYSITYEEACLKIIKGSPRNQYFFLPEREMHVGRGRNDSNYIIIKDRKVNKKHAKLINYHGEVKITCFNSKSKILINGKPARSCILKKNDEIKMGHSTFRYIPAREFISNNDPLLQIYNAKYFQERLEDEFKNNKKLYLLFYDLDFFKEINDESRNYVLKELTMLIQNEHLRDEDIFSKYKEEGFTILLIDIDIDLAHEIAEKIRSSVETHLIKFNEKKPQSITLSIGVSEKNSSVKTSNDLLIHAKEACIKAKKYGHNQLVIWENEEISIPQSILKEWSQKGINEKMFQFLYESAEKGNNEARMMLRSKFQPPITSQNSPFPPDENKGLTIDTKWYSILDEKLPLIEPKHYFMLSKLIPQQKLLSHEIHANVAVILPYIRQKIKMREVDVLKEENLINLVVDENKKSIKSRLSRFDCIAALFASSECSVAQDIFRTVSQLPIAFPLLIPDLENAENFKVMLPLFTGSTIKCCTNNGSIIENHLFEDPFKVIVAVRTGLNSLGKSYILNQLMASKDMFSSCSELRTNYGIRHMVDGSVEFVWLTEETCDDNLWNSVFKKYYKQGRKEIILLANLHGDALNYHDQLKFLKHLPSYFWVFLQPEHENQKVELEKLIGSEKVKYIDVNLEDNAIYKNFEDVVDSDPVNHDNFSINELEMGKTLQLAENTECNESQEIIDCIKRKKCCDIKLEIMQLQGKQLKDGFFRELQLFSSIIELPIGKRIRALAHLERELSRLSTIDLGIEHFFRGLGHMYKFVFNSNDSDNPTIVNISRSPKHYAELLINGHAIELLDSDSTIISEVWFLAVCGHIDKKFPNLRIFVISILGPQSSGKSTLLNTLFASKFPVSTGRCTRGILMRFLFLEKGLSNQLGVDAFILIDTEGLGAPEKIDMPELETNDRKLANFTMQLSNLTIINTLGDSKRVLTKILRAIGTMTNLHTFPNILIVQHVAENNKTKLELEPKFHENFQEVLKTVNIEFLNKMKDKKLLKVFAPFKNGTITYSPQSKQYHEDVADLYESIMNSCENLQSKNNFSHWFRLIKSNWDAILHKDSSIIKINETYNFIELGKKIAKLKEIIDMAFLKHKELIEKEISTTVKEWRSKGSNVDLIKPECEKLIKKLDDVPEISIKVDCVECKKVDDEKVKLNNYLKERNDVNCKNDTNKTIDEYIKDHRKSTSTELENKLEDILNRDENQFFGLYKFINRLLEIALNPQEEINKIWESLRGKVLAKKEIMKEEIINEVGKEYGTDLKNQINRNIPESSDLDAIWFRKKRLEKNDIERLKKEINRLITQILSENDNFDPKIPEIITELKDKTEKILNDLSAELKVEFNSDFKTDIHVYAILTMLKILENSNNHDTLLGVLDEMEVDCKEKIQLRVKYDNLYIYKGHVAGDYLLKAIHKKAIDAENRYQRDNILSIPWIKDSETIRLEYFIELAKQIHNGDKDKAVLHFLSPKETIEKWFKNKVNKYTNKGKKYQETSDKLFNDVYHKIRDYKSYNGISKFVNSYMTEVDVDYQLSIKDNSIDENFDMFHEAIMKELDDKRSSYFQLNEEKLLNPSDDELVKRRLGCTEHCPWCGALCWGERGHDKNSGETNRHHTSHQPEGLMGTIYEKSKKLQAIACHKCLDKDVVHYKIENDEISRKWGEAKSIDFKNWTFEPHYITNFNEIMCWFFEQLHIDLAEKFECNPADESKLKKYGCFEKDYNNIISVLHQCLENDMSA